MSAELRERLENLRKLRDLGVTSNSVDGESTTFASPADLQAAINRLERQLGLRRPQVRSRSVYMGHR